jgi:hypothetical protein
MSEKLKTRPISEGARIAGLLFIRDIFSIESRGVGDDDFWTQFERRVKRIPTIEEACFEYRLNGFEPRVIAEMLLDEIPEFRIESRRPTNKLNREQIINLATGSLFEHYPEEYRERIWQREKKH